MEPTTIRKLFSDQDHRFEIPAYQRAYSWDSKNVEQFLADVREVKQDYYLGHFLFERERTNETAQGPEALLVIDGQQRLTTCIIFFSVLHRLLAGQAEAAAAAGFDLKILHHLFLKDGFSGMQRLRTVREDNNFFVDEILDGKLGAHPDPDTASQKRMREAQELMEKACGGNPLEELKRWHDVISNARCTRFEVSGKVEAARIFAFQNDRGKKLSDLEVLKSFCFLQVYLHSPAAMAAEHLNYLEDCVSHIYRQVVRVILSEDDVLRYHWQGSGQGYETRETLNEIKAYLLDGCDEEVCDRIKEFMAGLAKAFVLVEKVEKSAAADVRNLRYLNNLALAYPFLIRAYLHGATEPQIERLARLLENVTFRSQLRGRRAEINSRLNHFLRLEANANYVETVVEGVVRALREQDWWHYWSDTNTDDNLDRGDFYGNRVDNYVLWRYELRLCESGSASAPPKIEYRNLLTNESIEHIAPQTETAGGAVAGGYGPYEDEADKGNGIVSGEWMNCLGNLMLVSQGHNSAIGNRAFDVKLASYGRDNLLNQQKEIVRFVTDQTNPVWDKAAIERRHAAIMEAAKEMWSLDRI